MNSVLLPHTNSTPDPVDAPHTGPRAVFPRCGCSPAMDVIPLALQSSMYRASLGDRRLYRQRFVWKLRGKVDRLLMRRAWEATFLRHEIFSLAMSRDNGNDLVFSRSDGPVLAWADREADECGESVGWDECAEGSSECFPVDLLEKGAVQQLSLVRWPGERWELHWESHHAWMDGRSRRIVLNDVRSAYSRLQAGKDPFTEPASSFSAFAASRRRLSESSASLAFWHAHLSGIQKATPLRFGMQHRPEDTGEAGFRTRFRVTLPADLQDILDRRSCDLGVTVNSIFQGTWGLFLSRTACTGRVVFGAPRACRHVVGNDAAGVVGLVMNVVPVAVTVDDHEPVADFLRRIRGAWLAMRPHETVPLVTIAAHQGIRDLFESVLAFEERHLPEADDGIGWQEVGSHLEGWTDLPLVIQVIRGASIELDLAGCGRRFPGKSLEELADRLMILARNLLADPAQPVGGVGLLDADESARLLAYGAGAEAPPVKSVIDRFDAIVARHGERIAVEMGDRRLTYAEIWALSDRLARALRASGILPGDRVAVRLDRSPETVVLFIAILRAGAAYVPIDSRYPAARVERILTDATPRMIVTRSGGLSGVETGSVTVATLDQLAWPAGNSVTEEPLPPLFPDSPAYVMYSSGSMGEPKGIVIPHRGITRLVVEPDYVLLNSNTRTLQLASLAFDAATFEIWGPLLNGGCCVLYPGEVPDLHTLKSTLAGKRVNTAFFTTSLFNLIARENPRLLAPLREVGVGGEALVPEWIGRVYQELPSIRLFNGYGPTENTTFSVCHRIPRDHDFRRPIPLGRPIRGSSAHVVDHGGRLLPHGVAGELLLGGDGVALGYLNKPELSAGRFGPSSGSFQGIFYRSGDLALVRPDGLIEFVDRIDDQLKVRGFRVEPAEIQGELLRLPGVRAAHVAGERQRRGEKRLVAWIVANPGMSVGSDILEPLARRLPDYMIPASVVFVDELPLNLNGKIDSNALPSPRGRQKADHATDEFTATEQEVAGLWEESLGRRPDSRKDGYTLAGGDSLAAVTLLMKITRKFGVRINHGELMSDDSLQSIAGLIDRKRKSGSGCGVPRLQKFNRREGLKPTPVMRDFYVKRERNPEDRMNQVVVRGFILRGDLDRAALETAVRLSVDEHEILRTSLKEQDGDLHLHVVPPGSGHVQWNDLSTCDRGGTSSALAAALRIHDEECRKDISVFDPSPVRVRLARIDGTTHLLTVAVHHMVFDGTSMRIFLKSVSERYHGNAGQEVSGPVPPQFDYWDEFHSVKRWMGEERRSEALEFLRCFFGDFPDASLPVEEAGQIGIGEELAYRFWAVDHALAREVDRTCVSRGITPYVFFLTVVKMLYARYRGDGDNPMATFVDRRFLEGSQRIIGDFGETRYLRERIDEEGSIADACSVIASSVANAFSYETITRADVLEIAPLEMNILKNKASCPKVLLQPEVRSALNLQGIEVNGLERTQHRNDHRIQFVLQDWSSSPTLKVVYPRSLFRDAAMERLVFNLEQIMRISLDRPDTLLRELPDLRDREAGLRPLDREEREGSAFQRFTPLGFELGLQTP